MPFEKEKMRNISYLITPDSGTLTIYVKDKSYNVDSTNNCYNTLLEYIDDESKQDEDFIQVLDKALTVKEKFGDYVEVVDGAILYKGEVVHNVIAERILNFIDRNLPYKPLVRFLENLMENPSYNSRQELYKFLENKGFPITEDGHFLAYKSVTQDYKDLHTRTLDYTIGTVTKMPRHLVDDSANHSCSSGLHAGNESYALSFGGSNTNKILVKINPRDVVSIPSDTNCQKLRCCRFESYALYKEGLDDDFYPEEEQYEEDCCDYCPECDCGY